MATRPVLVATLCVEFDVDAEALSAFGTDRLRGVGETIYAALLSEVSIAMTVNDVMNGSLCRLVLHTASVIDEENNASHVLTSLDTPKMEGTPA